MESAFLGDKLASLDGSHDDLGCVALLSGEDETDTLEEETEDWTTAAVETGPEVEDEGEEGGKVIGEGFLRWINEGNLGGLDLEVEDDLLLVLLGWDGKGEGDDDEFERTGEEGGIGESLLGMITVSDGDSGAIAGEGEAGRITKDGLGTCEGEAVGEFVGVFCLIFCKSDAILACRASICVRNKILTKIKSTKKKKEKVPLP